MRTCIICERKFPIERNRVTCSDTCSRQRRRERRIKYYHKNEEYVRSILRQLEKESLEQKILP